MRSTTRWRSVLIASAAAVAVYMIANAAELLLIRNGTAPALLVWASDLIPATAFGLATSLWLDLRATRATLTELEREQIVLDTQLSLAASIQRRSLPPMPMRAGGLRWAACLEPAGRIGGDFYDYVECAPDSVLLLLADISGKGIPAALLLASTRTVFRSLARETGDPAQLLTRLSQTLYAAHDGSPYITCIVARFNFRECSVTYSNAGHPPGLIVGGRGRRLLNVGGPPAGILPSAIYRSETVALQRQDVGLFVTDGVTEAIGQTDEIALACLESTITSPRSLLSAEAICSRAMMLARSASDGGPAEADDRTAVAFTVE